MSIRFTTRFDLSDRILTWFEWKIRLHGSVTFFSFWPWEKRFFSRKRKKWRKAMHLFCLATRSVEWDKIFGRINDIIKLDLFTKSTTADITTLLKSAFSTESAENVLKSQKKKVKNYPYFERYAFLWKIDFFQVFGIFGPQETLAEAKKGFAMISSSSSIKWY